MPYTDTESTTVTQCLLSQVSERQAAYSDKEGYGERVCLIFIGSV